MMEIAFNQGTYLLHETIARDLRVRRINSTDSLVFKEPNEVKEKSPLISVAVKVTSTPFITVASTDVFNSEMFIEYWLTYPSFDTSGIDLSKVTPLDPGLPGIFTLHVTPWAKDVIVVPNTTKPIIKLFILSLIYQFS
jgi:hypothetical protein